MASPMDFMTPGPEQLAGPGMADNNAMVGRQAWAQQALKDLLLKRMLQGMVQQPQPPLLGTPPVPMGGQSLNPSLGRPAPMQMIPGRSPFGGGL